MKRTWAGLLLCLLLLAAPAAAQTLGQGSIEGTVLDASGAAVPGATVKAVNAATGISTSVSADGTGYFRFAVLSVGKYELTIEKSGFATLTQKDVIVNVGSKVTLELSMQVAGQVTSVTVTTETPLVETARSSLSNTVQERSIANLPVNGRNFIDFVLLTPGVTRDVRLGDISFAGQRGTLNSLVVDGQDNNNTFFGQASGRTGSGRAPYQFSQESVQEFQVNSNSYTAELGRAGGAVINVVTKSGSNDWHGSAFWYYRDRSMNATDLIDKNAGRRKAPYHFNQFGGSFSGPIAKNRAFFFFNYDGQRNKLPNSVFLNLPSTFVPTTTFETAALAYLTARAGSWVRAQDQNTYIVKADWHISANNLLTVRWNNQRFTGAGFENGGSQNSFEHTGASVVKTDTVNGSLTTTISPTLINVARLGYMRDREPGEANSENPEAAVRQGGQTVLTVGRNFFSPRETTITRVNYSDTLSWVRGRHSFRFGGDFIHDRILNFFPGNFSGAFLFASLDDFGRSLNPTMGFPVSTASSLTQAFGGTGTSGATTRPNIFEFSFFVQDEWRVTSNLTLNFGIRYDLQKTAGPEVQNPVALANGIDTAQLNTDANNFAPRIGVAWTPFGNKRLVARAGYGIFYGRTPSIMVGTAHSNNGINVQTLVFTSATTPAMPSYPNNICGAPSPSPSCAAPVGVTGSAPTIFVMSPDYVQPLVHQGSLGVEYEFARDWSVGANYLVVRGIHLQRTRDINRGTPVATAIALPGTGAIFNVDRFPTTRPITAFARIAQFESTANSIYHGATLQLNKRFSQNYFLAMAYTLSKVIDDKPDATAVVPLGSDDAKLVQNPRNTADDRGPGDNDQRHRLVTSFVWDFDSYTQGMTRSLRAVAGGWQLSFIWTWQSGQPFTALVGGDLNRDGNSRYDRSPDQGRNTFRLPSFASVDPRITKTVGINERFKLLFLIEAFNLFNRANVTGVNATRFGCSSCTGATPTLTASTTFQRPTATSPFPQGPRILQLSAKFSF